MRDIEATRDDDRRDRVRADGAADALPPKPVVARGTAMRQRRHRADDALLLLDRVTQGVVVLDADGRVLSCNDRFATMIGLPSFVFLDATLGDYFSPRDALRFRALQLMDGDERTHDFTLRRFDSAAFPARISVLTLRPPESGSTRYGVLLTDLALRRETDVRIAAQAEQLVHEVQRRKSAEERYARVLRCHGLATWECDLVSGRALHAVRMSRVFARGASTIAWSVRAIIDAFLPADRQAIERAFGRVRESGSFDVDGRIAGPGGEQRRIRLEARLLPGSATHLAGCASDVTASRDAAVRPARRMPIGAAERTGAPTVRAFGLVERIGGPPTARRLRSGDARSGRSPGSEQSALLHAAQLSHLWLTSLHG